MVNSRSATKIRNSSSVTLMWTRFVKNVIGNSKEFHRKHVYLWSHWGSCRAAMGNFGERNYTGLALGWIQLSTQSQTGILWDSPLDKIVPKERCCLNILRNNLSLDLVKSWGSDCIRELCGWCHISPRLKKNHESWCFENSCDMKIRFFLERRTFPLRYWTGEQKACINRYAQVITYFRILWVVMAYTCPIYVHAAHKSPFMSAYMTTRLQWKGEENGFDRHCIYQCVLYYFLSRSWLAPVTQDFMWHHFRIVTLIIFSIL